MAILTRPEIIEVRRRVRSYFDRRRRVDSYLVRYWGDDGGEYRKSIECIPGAPRPIPPAIWDKPGKAVTNG